MRLTINPTALLALLLALLLSSCMSLSTVEPEASIRIKTILPKYIEHEQFVSIKEYLTGKETTKNRLILRSIAEERTGLYLIISLNEKISSLPADTEIICEIFMPGELNAKVFEFPLPKVNRLPKTKHLLIGLTGSDWPYKKDALPTAWKISFIDSKSQVITEKSSQVWSL
ncbi:MAG: hypothetical protein DBX03_01385 [Puniceicoccaceae bacterium]|nr:MAG: hypothetical protein DBX03_01385 [Puniceicoccaceae bacterium]